MTNTDLITTEEACALIGSPRRPGYSLDRSTLSRWVADGRITPAVRIRGAFLFARADIEALARMVAA